MESSIPLNRDGTTSTTAKKSRICVADLEHTRSISEIYRREVNGKSAYIREALTNVGVEETIHCLLIVFFRNLALSAEVTPARISRIQELLIVHHGYLTLDDLKLFLDKAEMAVYGEHYGQVDPNRFFSWLKQYREERDRTYRRLHQTAQQQQQQKQLTAPPDPEAEERVTNLLRKVIEQMGSSLAEQDRNRQRRLNPRGQVADEDYFNENSTLLGEVMNGLPELQDEPEEPSNCL